MWNNLNDSCKEQIITNDMFVIIVIVRFFMRNDWSNI